MLVKNKRVNQVVLLVMVAAISGLFLFMIKQFLMAIFMAGLFSAMAGPVYRRLLKLLNNRKNLASILTILAIVLLILIPLTILIGVVVGQAVHVGQSVTPWVESVVNEPGVVSVWLEKIPYYEMLLPYRDMLLNKAGQAVGMISNLLINSLTSLTKGTISGLFSMVIMLYVMFYFLTMGNALLAKILYYLPLTDHDEQRLLDRFTSVAGATLKSTMIIGILQGGLCGFAFLLAGIQGAVFWGTVMAVMSIIPAFGTAIVWIPALLILTVGGDYSGAVILAVICGGIAGNLDNILRPRLVGKDTEMHDLFVLFGTLGGITLFGILGIIIGPIIAALFITIWEIYGDAFQEYLPEVGLMTATAGIESDEEDTLEEKKEEETGKNL